MVILQLKGGLGNQLFQYAAATQLADNLNTTVGLDVSAYQIDGEIRSYMLANFNIPQRFVTKKQVQYYKKGNLLVNRFLKAAKPLYYHEKSLKYDDAFFAIKNSRVLLNGYFQSEQYFKQIRNKILAMFEVKNPPAGLNLNTINTINNTNSVSLHIRRGDYVTNPSANMLHGTCDMAYYQEALTFFKTRLANLHVFVFSDDIPWAKQNLDTLGAPATFVDFNTDETCYEDLRLMYLCKHNIIANSSFSWWGAWLNNNGEKLVIAPKKWFNTTDRSAETIVPETWIRL